jgi:hypothetical protein
VLIRFDPQAEHSEPERNIRHIGIGRRISCMLPCTSRSTAEGQNDPRLSLPFDADGPCALT